jgi:DNA-binding transcriptional LysR family regulator
MALSGRLIDAFLALEETRRFSIAAQRCHVSPSAFSQMITRLEEQVGARLFDRDTRNVSLTPEGEVFSSGAHRIDSEIRTTLTELRDRASRRTGRVYLAAPPSLAADWLPRLMAQLHQAHPGIALRLHDVVSDRCLEMILRGEVDFGLNAQPGNELEFDTQLLFNEPLYLLCRSNDPLTKLNSVKLRDLDGQPFIHTVRTGSVWQHMRAVMGELNVRDSGFEVAQFGTLAGLVCNGFGISIVPHFALPLCARKGLTSIRLQDKKAARPIFMIKRRGRTLSAAARELWSAIAHSVPQELALPPVTFANRVARERILIGRDRKNAT